MAALTLTSSSVKPSDEAIIVYGTTYEAIDAGEPVYRSTTFLTPNEIGKWRLGNAQNSGQFGIALNSAREGGEIAICIYDPDFTHGLSSVVAGDLIVVGTTAGALHKIADLTSGWEPQVMMACTSSTKAVLQPVYGLADVP